MTDKKESNRRFAEFLKDVIDLTIGEVGPFQCFERTSKNYVEGREKERFNILDEVAEDSEAYEGNERLTRIKGIETTEKRGLYFIENTLVPVFDGNRIIGPLEAREVIGKRMQYDTIVGEGDRGTYPFLLYMFDERQDGQHNRVS